MSTLNTAWNYDKKAFASAIEARATFFPVNPDTGVPEDAGANPLDVNVDGILNPFLATQLYRIGHLEGSKALASVEIEEKVKNDAGALVYTEEKLEGYSATWTALQDVYEAFRDENRFARFGLTFRDTKMKSKEGFILYHYFGIAKIDVDERLVENERLGRYKLIIGSEYNPNIINTMTWRLFTQIFYSERVFIPDAPVGDLLAGKKLVFDAPIGGYNADAVVSAANPDAVIGSPRVRRIELATTTSGATTWVVPNTDVAMPVEPEKQRAVLRGNFKLVAVA